MPTTGSSWSTNPKNCARSGSHRMFHKRVWPEMEKFLKHKNYTVLLYDYPKG